MKKTLRIYPSALIYVVGLVLTMVFSTLMLFSELSSPLGRYVFVPLDTLAAAYCILCLIMLRHQGFVLNEKSIRLVDEQRTMPWADIEMAVVYHRFALSEGTNANALNHHNELSFTFKDGRKIDISLVGYKYRDVQAILLYIRERGIQLEYAVNVFIGAKEV